MCFICPFTLQSAERVFRSLHLKCHCINSSLKQHNTQTLSDLLGFLIPPWKDTEVLITMTKYFAEIHTALCVGGDSDIGQRVFVDVRNVTSRCQILKTIPQNCSQVLGKKSKKYWRAWEIKDSKCQAWKWGAWSRSWKCSTVPAATPRNPTGSGDTCCHWEHWGGYTARAEK